MLGSLVVIEVSKTWGDEKISKRKHNIEQKGDIWCPDWQKQKFFIQSSNNESVNKCQSLIDAKGEKKNSPQNYEFTKRGNFDSQFEWSFISNLEEISE